MRVPAGLAKPIYIAQLIPPLAAFVGVGTATFFASLHLYDQAASPVAAEAPQMASPGSVMLAWEAAGAVAALVILALVWELVAYVLRDRARAAEAAAMNR